VDKSARNFLTTLATTLAVLAVAAAQLAAPAEAKKRPEGAEIVVAGTVTDTAGRAVVGVTVELRGTHRAFSSRDFRIKRRGLRVAKTQTDAAGNFEIHWLWHPYYNRFELVATIPNGPPESSDELLELGRMDLSKRMHQGDSVVATLQIEDASPVDSLREFLAVVDTDDERQVYQEMGKPDKVRHTRLPTHVETSWWYFEQGKVYRFRNGERDSLERFEPIPQNQD
jgi:hypothetical protein